MWTADNRPRYNRDKLRYPSDLQERAHAVLEEWKADLVIAGRVKKPGEALSLWMVPGLGEGTLDRGDRPYRLEDVTLGEDFQVDLQTQLVAMALAAVIPLAYNEERSRVLQEELGESTEKLARLLNGDTIKKPRHRMTLQRALGDGLHTLGERELDTANLEKAVAAYRAALEAGTLDSALEKAIEQVGDDPHWKSVDQASQTFVEALAEGMDADPWGDTTLPVPDSFTKNGEPPVVTLTGLRPLGGIEVAGGTVRIRFIEDAGTVTATPPIRRPRRATKPLVTIGRRPGSGRASSPTAPGTGPPAACPESWCPPSFPSPRLRWTPPVPAAARTHVRISKRKTGRRAWSFCDSRNDHPGEDSRGQERTER